MILLSAFPKRWLPFWLAGVILVSAFIVPSLDARLASEQARILSDRAALKLFPDPNSRTIAILLKDMIVDVAERQGDWVRVVVSSSEKGIPISGYLRAADVAIQETSAQEIPDRERGMVQIEFYGGYAVLAPDDLNLRAEYDEKHSQFNNDQLYAYYKAAGSVSQFTREADGELKRISRAFPFGFRLKLNVSRKMSFSLGLKYLTTKATSGQTLSYAARWPGLYWDTFETVLDRVDPFILSCRGIIPQLGFHYSLLASGVDLEAFFLGGIVFSTCKYSLEWTHIYSDGWNYSEGHKTIDEQGQGTGMSLEAGLRTTFHFGRRGGMFIEGGYAYQRIDRLNGPGVSDYSWENNSGGSASERSQWTGDWIIKQQTVREAWGTMTFQYPSNYSDDLSAEITKVRDFRLDLSGFQVRLGFYLAF